MTIEILIIVFSLNTLITAFVMAFLFLLYRKLTGELVDMKKQQEISVSNAWKNIKNDTALYFQKAINNFIINYQKQLNETKADSIKQVNNISNNIGKDAVLVLKQLTEDFQNEISSFRKIASGKINVFYQQTEKEIKEYKDEKLEEIDDKINAVIRQAAEEVIGKSLDTESHQELVLDALEKAKKEKFFEDEN